MTRRILVVLFALFMVFNFLPLQAMADTLVEDPPVDIIQPTPEEQDPPLTEEDPPPIEEEEPPSGDEDLPPAGGPEEPPASDEEQPPVMEEDPPATEEDLNPAEEDPLPLAEEPSQGDEEPVLELVSLPPYLDFTLASDDPAYPGTTGTGWTWDASGKVLALNNLALSIGEAEPASLLAVYDFAIQVPDGTTITVTGTNTITHTTGIGILCYGDLTINGTGTLEVNVYRNALRVIGDLVVSGLAKFEVYSDSYGGIRSGPGDEGENFMGSDGDVYLSDLGEAVISGYECGIRAMGDVFIDGIDRVSITSSSGSGIRSGPYNVDYFTSGALGNVSVTNCGSFSVDSYENGIRTYANVEILDVTTVYFVSSDNRGLMIGPGDGDGESVGAPANVVIDGVENFTIDSYYDGIKVIGNLTITNVDAFVVRNDYNNGLRVGPTYYRSSGEEGDLTIKDCSIVSIDAYDNAIRAMGDLLIENVEDIGLSSIYDNGIRVGLGSDTIASESDGNAQIISCGKLTVQAGRNGMRITGDLTIDGLDELILSAQRTGLRVGSSYYYEEGGSYSQSDSEGNITLKNLDKLDVEAIYKGLHANGNIRMENVPLAVILATSTSTDPAQGYGIMAGKGITVKLSDLYTYGKNFGMVTGWAYNEYNESPGGDIVIDQSYVDAQCETTLLPVSLKEGGGGYAAIFAGDNLMPEDEGHAQIILINAQIKEPVGGYIADVMIGEINCQSITDEEELMMDVITYWGEASDAVLIEPLFLVTYDGSGGTGAVTDTESPYEPDESATVLDNDFTLLGYTFDSWNTKVDGSGTEYAPGATFSIEGNVTLYAQWNKIPPVVNYVETDSETGTVTEGMKTNVTLPELTDPMTKEILVYVDVESASLDAAIRSKVLADLTGKGYELLDVLDITLMKRITAFDDSVVTEIVPNRDITGMITVRILLTGDQATKDNLAIAYISESGDVTVMTGTKVTLNGKTYLEFQTDHFSNYALIQELGDQEVNPATGVTLSEPGQGAGSLAPLPIGEGMVLLLAMVLMMRRRRVVR